MASESAEQQTIVIFSGYGRSETRTTGRRPETQEDGRRRLFKARRKTGWQAFDPTTTHSRLAPLCLAQEEEQDGKAKGRQPGTQSKEEKPRQGKPSNLRRCGMHGWRVLMASTVCTADEKRRWKSQKRAPRRPGKRERETRERERERTRAKATTPRRSGWKARPSSSTGQSCKAFPLRPTRGRLVGTEGSEARRRARQRQRGESERAKGRNTCVASGGRLLRELFPSLFKPRACSRTRERRSSHRAGGEGCALDENSERKGGKAAERDCNPHRSPPPLSLSLKA